MYMVNQLAMEMLDEINSIGNPDSKHLTELKNALVKYIKEEGLSYE